jgi:hypothetical protein
MSVACAPLKDRTRMTWMRRIYIGTMEQWNSGTIDENTTKGGLSFTGINDNFVLCLINR